MKNYTVIIKNSDSHTGGTILLDNQPRVGECLDLGTNDRAEYYEVFFVVHPAAKPCMLYVHKRGMPFQLDF
jgi:hypothetical protein